MPSMLLRKKPHSFRLKIARIAFYVIRELSHVHHKTGFEHKFVKILKTILSKL
jgi:hypothetical protein